MSLVSVKMGKGVVDFCADSGLAATAVSASAVETAERDTRTALGESKFNLCTATGESLDTQDEATLNLGIGDRSCQHSVVAGDIGSSAGSLS